MLEEMKITQSNNPSSKLNTNRNSIHSNNSNNSNNSNRSFLFDNVRGILIFLVVVGHLLRTQLGFSNALDAIYYYIFLFHMPAFIFITGYFSKRVDKCRETALENFFIPYLLLNTFFWAYNRFVLDLGDKPLRIFSPQWGLWFLLCVFIWKLLLKDLVRIRFILPISFLLGILSGYTGEFTNKFGLARLFAFLPFFLLGFYCNETMIERIRKIPKFITAAVLIGYGAIAYYIVSENIFSRGNLYMKGSYDSIKNLMVNGYITRTFLYVSAIVITVCLINLISSKETFLAQMGRNSITVYILHLFILINIRKYDFPWDGTRYYIAYALIAAGLITFICSRQFVLNAYNFLLSRVNIIWVKTSK